MQKERLKGSSPSRVNPWQELRRRKVFRTAGLYIVGAWLVIQVADIFFPAWGLPETTIRYLLLGSVGSEGERVRVTARLLDETGAVVWSDRFDRWLE